MTVLSPVVVLLPANSVAFFEKSGIFLPVCFYSVRTSSTGRPFEKFDAALG
jgi:hypothetical protein